MTRKTFDNIAGTTLFITVLLAILFMTISANNRYNIGKQWVIKVKGLQSNKTTELTNNYIGSMEIDSLQHMFNGKLLSVERVKSSKPPVMLVQSVELSSFAIVTNVDFVGKKQKEALIKLCKMLTDEQVTLIRRPWIKTIIKLD